jgi:hypothetical protein
MQSEMLHAFRSSRHNAAMPLAGEGASRALAGTGAEIRQDVVGQANGEQEPQAQGDRANVASASRDMAISFLRLANLHCGPAQPGMRGRSGDSPRRSSRFTRSSADSPIRSSSGSDS